MGARRTEVRDDEEVRNCAKDHGDNLLLFLCSIPMVDREADIVLFSVIKSLVERDKQYVLQENEFPSEIMSGK